MRRYRCAATDAPLQMRVFRLWRDRRLRGARLRGPARGDPVWDTAVLHRDRRSALRDDDAGGHLGAVPRAADRRHRTVEWELVEVGHLVADVDVLCAWNVAILPRLLVAHVQNRNILALRSAPVQFRDVDRLEAYGREPRRSPGGEPALQIASQLLVADADQLRYCLASAVLVFH
jgi:hypothetical protein